jgi:hypothetical protein
MREIAPVTVAGAFGTRAATVNYGSRGDECHLELNLDDGRVFSASDGDYFACLVSIRRELEAQGIVVCCQGARKDVWPSGMARDMAAGLQAYVLTIGRTPLRSEVVGIFDPADRKLIGTVADQEQYFHLWWSSPRARSG